MIEYKGYSHMAKVTITVLFYSGHAGSVKTGMGVIGRYPPGFCTPPAFLDRVLGTVVLLPALLRRIWARKGNQHGAQQDIFTDREWLTKASSQHWRLDWTVL